jgi:transporter family protein
MQSLINDWRFFILAYLILAGVWGLLAKIASNRLGPLTASCIALTFAWLTVSLVTLKKINLQLNIGMLAAVICGIFGGLSSLLFYKALQQAPASTVIPVSSLYLVITVVLSCFFLGETLKFKQIVGIAFAILSIILLIK